LKDFLNEDGESIPEDEYFASPQRIGKTWSIQARGEYEEFGLAF
jgi:hypothetical protein